MMIGIDFGSSFVKVVVLKPDGEILCEKFPSNDISRVKDYFVNNKSAIINCDFSSWCFVGAGSMRNRDFYETLSPKPFFEGEMNANSMGIQYILKDPRKIHIHGGTGKISDRYLIVSMGTGISLCLYDGNETKHIGGAVIGGGTLMALSKLILGITDFDQLKELAKSGNPQNLDLMIEDLYGEDYISESNKLTKGIVASSLAKAGRDSGSFSEADIAASIIATVSYAIGTHVSIICNSLNVETCVFISGFLDTDGIIADNLKRSVNLFSPNVTLVIPDHHHYAGAIGAALYAQQLSTQT